MADPRYAIVPVDQATPEYRDESMGTKRKFWFGRVEQERKSRRWTRWLFKYSQAGTGQDWAEKLACELAEALRLPHAQVELAEADGQPGCIVKTVIEDPERDMLEHGNQVLYVHDPSYPREQASPAEHTVERVLRTLDALDVSPPRHAALDMDVQVLQRGADWFVGYLLLDALIGNTDRHHENWAVLQSSIASQHVSPRTLSPTFDHGSSLGRELRDEERARRLKEGWASAGAAYARRARSGLYQAPGDQRPMHPVAAFGLSASLRPLAGQIFQRRLEALSEQTMDTLIERMPQQRMSAVAQRFTSLFLRHNRSAILALELAGNRSPGSRPEGNAP